jgi:hypothetical protein
VSIWLEIAKSILQDRLAEAERDRLVQEALAPREKRNLRQPPVLARLRHWSGVRAAQAGVVQDQVPTDAPLGNQPDASRSGTEGTKAGYVPQ